MPEPPTAWSPPRPTSSSGTSRPSSRLASACSRNVPGPPRNRRSPGPSSWSTGSTRSPSSATPRTLTQTLARACEVGVTVIALCDTDAAPTETTALVTVEPGGGLLRRLGGPSAPQPFVPAAVGVSHAERVARRLAPKRLVGDSIRAGRAGSGRLADLLAAAPTGAGLLAAARATRPATGAPAGPHWNPQRSCGCRSPSPPTGRRCCSTSRSPRTAATARTGSSSAPWAQARASCCAPWCARSPRPTGRTTSSWRSPTSRAASRSPC